MLRASALATQGWAWLLWRAGLRLALPGAQGQGAGQGTGLPGWPYPVNETLKEPLGDVNASAHLFLVLTEGQKALRTHPVARNLLVPGLHGSKRTHFP